MSNLDVGVATLLVTLLVTLVLLAFGLWYYEGDLDEAVDMCHRVMIGMFVAALAILVVYNVFYIVLNLFEVLP